MRWLLIAALGLAVGAAIRRTLPFLLRSRRLPTSGPWIELAGGALLLSAAWARGPGWWNGYVLTVLLLAAVVTDLRTQLIPDRLTLPGAALGAALSALWPSEILALLDQRGLAILIGLSPDSTHLAGLVLSLWGAVLGFAALELLRRLFSSWAGIQVMGMGDSKLLLLIGAFLGPLATALTLFLAPFLGTLFGLVYLLALRRHHFPFGPALAAAALVVWLAGERTVAAVLDLVRTAASLPRPLLGAFYLVMVLALLALLWRLRVKAAAYEREIEEEYRRIEEELDGPETQ